MSKSGVILFSKGRLTQFLNRWPLFAIGTEPITTRLLRLLFIDNVSDGCNVMSTPLLPARACRWYKKKPAGLAPNENQTREHQSTVQITKLLWLFKRQKQTFPSLNRVRFDFKTVHLPTEEPHSNFGGGTDRPHSGPAQRQALLPWISSPSHLLSAPSYTPLLSPTHTSLAGLHTRSSR